MKRKIKVVLSALLMASFGAEAASVVMARKAPYSEDAEIAEKVRSECVKLHAQLPAYTKEFAAEFGVEVTLVDTVETSAPWTRSEG